jgi:hypothetical protein
MTISWDASSRCVTAEWREFAVSQDYRAAMEFGLDLMREQGGSRWVSVYRRGIPLAAADSDWLATKWLPRAVRLGLTRLAFVYQDAALSRIAMRRVLKAASIQGLESTECTTIEDARRWVDRMEAAPLPF